MSEEPDPRIAQVVDAARRMNRLARSAADPLVAQLYRRLRRQNMSMARFWKTCDQSPLAVSGPVRAASDDGVFDPASRRGTGWPGAELLHVERTLAGEYPNLSLTIINIVVAMAKGDVLPIRGRSDLLTEARRQLARA